MLRLTACLLLTSAALAQHYGPSGASSSVPMDFNDDIYNRDLRIQPSSNFFYNFQQARIDQPPQVEVREENLGKYMGRPRPSTTAMPIPKLDQEYVPDMNTVHLHRLADKNSVSTMTPYVPLGPYNAHLPATMPPPPTTPRWMDLSDDSFRNHAHHKPSRYAAKPVNTYQPASTPAPVQPTYQPASMPLSYNDGMYSQQQPMPMEMSYQNQMPQYYDSTTENVMHGDRYVREPAAGRGRGSHKFSMNDLQLVPTEPPQVMNTMRPAGPASVQKRPPPSIPTLTPWSGDSFGK
ncbi:uncharacterized protein LOC135088631 [Ostrinia nubilalis]